MMKTRLDVPRLCLLLLLLLLCLWRTEPTRVQEDGAADADPSSLCRSDGNKRREAREAPEISTLPDNMTRVVVDTQRYYTWESFGPTDRGTEELWVNLDGLQVQIHGILSSTHRQAARVALSFDFPFYGHYLRQIIIATGGFIFMGDVTHRMLTATQYVAPLMANFDPSFSRNSTVRYSDNGNMFVVQWDRVRLKQREAEGHFTFQAALHRNGTIIFSYQDVPVPVAQINSTEHPVKVGLSDAFMARVSTSTSTSASERNRQTIYEYHRVEVDASRIVSRSAFVFTPLPTCLQLTSCLLCLTSDLVSGCGWCNTLQRCSDGVDRHRQEWLDYGCPEQARGSCQDFEPPQYEGPTGSFNDTSPPPAPSSSPEEQQPVTQKDQQTSPPDHQGATENAAIVAGVAAALLLLVALTLLAVYYINTHPTVAPPFYLMQQRSNNYWPSMKFRNQGCSSSYTEVELGGHEKDGFIEAEQCC